MHAVHAIQLQPYVIGVDPGTVHGSICVMAVDRSRMEVWECSAQWSGKYAKPRPEDLVLSVHGWLARWLDHPMCQGLAAEKQMNNIMVRLEQACLCLAHRYGKPFVSVHPVTWKHDYWKQSDVKGWTQNKAASLAVARLLYPDAQLTHNMSDALLIARHYALLVDKSMTEKMIADFLQ